MNNNNTCTYQHCEKQASYAFAYNTKHTKKEKIIKLCFTLFWKCIEIKLDPENKMIKRLKINQHGKPYSHKIIRRTIYKDTEKVKLLTNSEGNQKRRKSKK